MMEFDVTTSDSNDINDESQKASKCNYCRTNCYPTSPGLFSYRPVDSLEEVRDLAFADSTFSPENQAPPADEIFKFCGTVTDLR